MAKLWLLFGVTAYSQLLCRLSLSVCDEAADGEYTETSDRRILFKTYSIYKDVHLNSLCDTVVRV